MLSRKDEVWQMQFGSRLQLAGRRLVTQLLAHDGRVAAVCAYAIPTNRVEAARMEPS